MGSLILYDGLEQPIANWAKRREGGRDRDWCSEASGIRYSRSLSYSGVIALEEGPVDPWHIYYTPSPPNTATPPNPPSQDHHTSSFLRLVCFIIVFYFTIARVLHLPLPLSPE